MALQALMVDVDGVLLVHPHPAGWSASLERDLGLSAAVLQREFFAPHWDDVIHGRAGLHERLGPVLSRVAPHLTSEQLATYWFEQDYHPDDQLLADLALVRAWGIAVHLATVQEHERAQWLWRAVRWSERFDAMHYAADLGCAKPSADFFAAIERNTGLAPCAIAFIDDKPANVEAAIARGWRARVWTGRERLADVFPELPSPIAR